MGERVSSPEMAEAGQSSSSAEDPDERLQNAETLAGQELDRAFQRASCSVAQQRTTSSVEACPVAQQRESCSVAQQNNEPPQDEVAWQNFQRSASAISMMYKSGVSQLKKCADIALRAGHNKRNEELLAWVERMPSVISRDELLAFLCNRQLPPQTRHSPQRKHHPYRGQSGSRIHGARLSVGQVQTTVPLCARMEKDVSKFNHAEAIEALDSAMSGISVGHRSHVSSSSQPKTDPNPFVVMTNEHRKRSAPAQDVSPRSKRFRQF